jgi:hypothetical protein
MDTCSNGQRYYESVTGRWRGHIDFALTDRQALLRSRLRLVDKFNLIAMTWLVRLFGRLTIETSVRILTETGGTGVLHTTRITKWALPLFISEERIDLDDGGNTATIRLVMRTAPLLWSRRVSPPGTVALDTDGCGARYRFEWLGADMEQHGRVSDDHNTVTLEQTTAFSTSRQVLARLIDDR